MPRLGGTDQDLVVRIAQGDLDALGELFLRYHQQVLSFAHRMVGDVNVADSVTQDVFVRVLRHADKFNPEQKVRPWLYTIAANLCRDHLSKQGRRGMVEMVVEPPTTNPGPFEQIATREECACVKKAVQELPEIYREIIVMRIYEQLPYAEIASILDIREGTARSRMEYALNRLRKVLTPLRDSDSPLAEGRAGESRAGESRGAEGRSADSRAAETKRGRNGRPRVDREESPREETPRLEDLRNEFIRDDAEPVEDDA